MAGLLGIPRQFAEAVGEDYRERFGQLQPADAGRFKAQVEGATHSDWARILDRSPLVDRVDPGDFLHVWRQIQGRPI